MHSCFNGNYNETFNPLELEKPFFSEAHSSHGIGNSRVRICTDHLRRILESSCGFLLQELGSDSNSLTPRLFGGFTQTMVGNWPKKYGGFATLRTPWKITRKFPHIQT